MRPSSYSRLARAFEARVVRILSHLQIKRQDEAELIEQKRREEAERQQLAFQHAQASALPEAEQESGQRQRHHSNRWCVMHPR